MGKGPILLTQGQHLHMGLLHSRIFFVRNIKQSTGVLYYSLGCCSIVFLRSSLIELQQVFFSCARNLFS